MSHIILPPDWNELESEITPESVYHNRREFLKLMGVAGASLAGAFIAPPAFAQSGGFGLGALFGGTKLETDFEPVEGLHRNPAFSVERPITPEKAALTYNNFYEFTADKRGVWKRVHEFQPRPWQVEVGGHVNKPAVYDVDDLLGAMPIEERVYRHRCVEAWSMVVPWNGFPLKALIKKVEPTARAKFVKFTSFYDPEVAPGQRQIGLPWPYTEGLTLAEAMNELTFLATGIYGHLQPPQHGAPIRLVTPWKYGYKSIKSIVKIEFTETQPKTFWNTLVPHEYGFVSNVDPEVPHPRWSQKEERMIGIDKVVPTLKYNGYGKWVANLYA